MRAAAKPRGKAMYVAPKSDRAWLLNEQRKLHARSRSKTDYVFRKLWGLISDPRNLRVALARVSKNRGRRTAGVDRLTVKMVLAAGAEAFLDATRALLRSGSYRPSAVRRVLIPKPGQPGKFRPLGIPTVRDRVVQAAVKNILEPIFEADFYTVSYGFRPGKSAHGALAHLRTLLLPRTHRAKDKERLPFEWAIEGDIKGCFDNIDHHGLMERVRRRVLDTKVNRLVVAFLKSGVLAEAQFARTEVGTPQGGILSPLLANIALSVIEERYERHVWPSRTPTPRTDPEAIERRARDNRSNDKRRGRVVYVPIRYADDFIVLVSLPAGLTGEKARAAVEHEKKELAKVLKERLGLELSETKTLVTPVTSTMRFLGHHVRVRLHRAKKRKVCAIVVPKDRSQRLRALIKDRLARSTVNSTLEGRLLLVNPLLRGWCNFYRHAWGAKRVFTSMDHYVWWAILRWLRKKHARAPMRQLAKLCGQRKPRGRMLRWQENGTNRFECARVRVGRFWLTSRPPAFATTPMESPVLNERGTPGSAEGAQKPHGVSRERR